MALVTIRSDELNRFAVMARQDVFGKKLLTSMRRRIKEVGQVAVVAVKHKLQEPAPSDGPDEGHARAALAAATGITVSFAARSGGVKISTRSTGLSPEHKAILKVYNKVSTRHPVFGDRGNWVTQKGNPYFGAAIKPVVDDRMLDAMKDALEDAMRAIGARGL
jgi:hypothetical protein